MKGDAEITAVLQQWRRVVVGEMGGGGGGDFKQASGLAADNGKVGVFVHVGFAAVKELQYLAFRQLVGGGGDTLQHAVLPSRAKSCDAREYKKSPASTAAALP